MKPANDNTPLHYLSVCAGIEAASVAWHPLGWRACLLSEIEKFPRRVLAHHYPAVRQWGDFTAIRPRFLRRLGVPMPAILVGGTPCQAFSVAGARRSLQDARGNLTLSFVRLAHALANTGSLRNVVWENVPGVLSTKDNAFGCFLGALVGADDAISPPGGGSWPNAGMVSGPKGRAAWRVLDAQYFGLAQRRRRVFVVADFGNGADPAAVLFEPVSMHGNFAPRREAGQGVARGFASSSFGGFGDGGGLGTLRAQNPQSSLIAYAPEVSRCVATREGSSQDYETTTMVVNEAPIAFDPRQTDVPVTGDITGALDASYPGPAICFSSKDYGADADYDISPTLRACGHTESHANAGAPPAVAFDTYNQDAADVCHTLRRGSGSGDAIPATLTSSAVRRLTPRECERLQGFPDDYTLLPGYDADGPRYKALGNSMAVPCMRWIGERIARFLPTNDNLKKAA